ncbi:hypothetical protein J1N35_037715 [Gossypium stocksii]|uniref:Stress response protein NST1 n=1 Tax=Gossypium stocksii TaxID=47602 RepID=A0A9D3UKN3_9ROSI|nr:hypothetical protein J1N35_037715 [Gossypium stocksii]
MPSTNKTLLFSTSSRVASKSTAMANSFRTLSKTLTRSFSTKSSHHNHHQKNHKYLDPNSFLGSWKTPNDPKEAEKKLALLRRDYAKQVKNVRKEYIHEMELLRLEKLRKEEARKEAIRVANEERKRLKAEAAKVRAQERMVAEEEFRQTLLKERAEKLENWRMKQTLHGNKKKEAKDLVRRRSSMWIEEQELESKIFSAIVF